MCSATFGRFAVRASALALLAGFGLFAAASIPATPFGGLAHAEDGSGGPDNSKGNQGGQGQGDQGAQAGQDNQGGSGTGQGGPDPDSDSKGPQAGGPADTGSSGGKPAWAQEGIPEVDLGRLSVARSPDQVLDRAEAEAVATVTDAMLELYNQPLDDIILDLSLNWDTISLYDSPLQNLALFKDVLEDGETNVPGLDDSDDAKLLAVFLGVASDKTLTISADTATAIVTILGADLETTISVDIEQLAIDAEAVRIAVLAGHDG